MIGKKILFWTCRQDPNTDRVISRTPHTGVIIDRIRSNGDTKYLVQPDDQDKPMDIYPEDIEKFIIEPPTQRQLEL